MDKEIARTRIAVSWIKHQHSLPQKDVKWYDLSLNCRHTVQKRICNALDFAR